jgi:hypothetical protein
MRTPFDDLLNEITEVRDADQMRIEARMARLERIVQKLLLALVEKPEDDPIVGIMPQKNTRDVEIPAFCRSVFGRHGGGIWHRQKENFT